MRGPKCKLGYHRVFNLILWVFYTGMQWKCMPVPKGNDGTALIHYTTIYKVFARWADDGSLDQAFIASVRHLAEQHHLDLTILHGDGTNTVAKKGGDGIGYSGHKHQMGEKIIAIVDNNGFVLAPLPVAPVNEADTVLLPEGLNTLKRVARLTELKIDGSYLNLLESLGFSQNFLSSCELEALHFIGIRSFGEEFREDVVFRSIQEKFGKPLA
jgi:transposase